MNNTVIMCICLGFLMIVAPIMGAEQPIEIKIQSIEIIDISINPALNISYFDDYNITVTVNSSVDIHTVEFAKDFINGEGGNQSHFYVNGTYIERESYGYHHNLTYTENNGTYNIIQRPDQLYPVITFGLNREVWYNVPQDIPIWQQNYHIMHFENPFIMTKNTTLFYEFNAEPNSITPPTSQVLSVYIVEKNHTIDFFETDWWITDNVELMRTFTYNDLPQHKHTDNSSHYLVPMSTNDDGTIGTKHLNVTDDFWMVLMSNANSVSKGWSLKWHGTEIDNNTAHWYVGNKKLLTTTHHEGVPDSHIHFVRKNGIVDGMEISFKVINSLNEIDILTEEFYFGVKANYPPNPTEFITPIPDVYTGEVNISWYPCNDPNGDDVYYTLELIDNENNTIMTLLENVTETYTIWNTTIVDDGIYDLKIIATDGTLSSDFYLSDKEWTFEIDNIPPLTLYDYMFLIILAVAPVIIIIYLFKTILNDVGKINDKK